MIAPRWRRSLASQGLVLVIVLLPVLVAGAGIDGPAAAGEWERLAGVMRDDHQSTGSVVADSFLHLCGGDAASWPAAGLDRDRLVDARLGQLAGIAAIVALGYFAIVVASGRARALLALVFACLLPPLAREGIVVRPDTAATVFGLLGLLLLQCVPLAQRPSARGSGSNTSVVALCLTAAVAFALAAATAPGAGILLLVPGSAAFVAAGRLAWRYVRLLRQQRWWRMPLRAGNRRLWPWALASIAALGITAVVLQVAVSAPENRAVTTSAVTLLPESPWLRWPLLALAALGAVRLLLRTGQRLGRGSRLAPDLLLLVYIATLLLQRQLRPADDDALPAVLPLAVLLADGSVQATLLIAARLRRRR